MISVIIPTMWYAKDFCDFLQRITELSVVDEIIIINNNSPETPDHASLKHPKVKMHNMHQNIFVAPSWNLGAKLACNETLAFLSDDVIVNLNVFQRTYDFIQDKTEIIGVVSVLTDDVNDHSYFKFFKEDSIQFFSATDVDPEKRPPSIGMGNLFFLQKKDWIDIPEEIKIFHGEALIWNYFYETKRNFIIADCKIETKWHTTWEKIAELDADEFNKIQMSDQEFCNSINYDLRNYKK